MLEPSGSPEVVGYRDQWCRSVRRGGGEGGCSTPVTLPGCRGRPRKRPSVAGCLAHTAQNTGGKGKKMAMELPEVQKHRGKRSVYSCVQAFLTLQLTAATINLYEPILRRSVACKFNFSLPCDPPPPPPPPYREIEVLLTSPHSPEFQWGSHGNSLHALISSGFPSDEQRWSGMSEAEPFAATCLQVTRRSC